MTNALHTIHCIQQFIWPSIHPVLPDSIHFLLAIIVQMAVSLHPTYSALRYMYMYVCKKPGRY